MQETIAFLNTLADASGAVIEKYFRHAFVTETKSPHDPVTEADRQAEKTIRALIGHHYPHDTIIGEEFGETTGTSGRAWVIDPIDGTRAFAVGRATFVTMVALCVDGVPVAGLIDQPIARDRWIGAAGMTTHNDRLARVRPCNGDPALIMTAPRQFTTQVEMAMHEACVDAARFSTYGGDGYAYGLLASGYADAVVEAGLKLHDVMPLVPIVQGAGGLITDWQGRVPTMENCKGQTIAAGDPAVHQRLLALAS